MQDFLTHGDIMNCPFCITNFDNGLPCNDIAYSQYDLYPTVPLHVLVIPKTHYETYFHMPHKVKHACMLLVDDVFKFLIQKDQSITGFNVGFNAGVSAGQTVMHTHIHVIPRRDGDVENPKGGVRHAVIGHGSY